MGMDPNVVEGQEDDVMAALTAAPSFSIVLPFDSLFDGARGIYSNALNYGRDWERPASLELIYPPDFPPEPGPRARHGDRDGFAVNAGVRIRGGWSRNDENPKHAFRLYFRGEYGPSTLSYALFGDEGVDGFDKFDLRTSQNYSWSFNGSPANTMVREVFSRDTQRDMGVPYTRSRYYHLYLNGQYWGLFQTQERSDHWHGASYLGGNPDDYDVIKSAGLDGGYDVEVTAGVFDDWRFLYDEANRLAALPAEEERDALYMKLQGLNPDGSRNPDYPVLLDADNLIQYMLIIFWTGNTDSPITPFNGTNNFFGIRERGGERGFTWFAHDSEHSLFSTSQFGDGHNRTGPFPAGDQFQRSNPQWLHQQLMGSNEYRLRFADLAQRHLSGNGTLTAAEALARWTSRANEVRPIILAESARWGDSKREPAFTPADWLREVTSVENGFLTTRTPIILEQLRNTYRYEFGRPHNARVEAPLYPAVDAPVFSHPEGESSDPFTLTMQTASGGTVFYTMDGADPRMPGGDVSGSAMAYDGAGIALSGYNRILARVRSDDGAWSALEEAEYFAGVASPGSSRLVISEIHYNPTEPTDAEIAAGFDNNDDFEFIELHNPSSAPAALGGLAFTDGIAFAFGDQTLAPGARIVVAASENAFRMRYGPGAKVAGSYASGRLSNGGEALTLSNAAGERLIHIEYNDGGAWPARADGGGSSLTLDPAAADHIDRAGAWRASVEYGGSPGASGRASFRDVIVNELLAHSDPPEVDAIELYNPTSRSIDIGGWLLSDGAPLDKYRIPDGTTIEAGGYVVFDENDFNAPGAENGFALSSAYGDEVRLVAADASGNPALFADEVAFGATRAGETIGLPPGGIDAFVPLEEPTLGGPNSTPRPAQVVFREIMYHPPGNNPNLEYVALYNAGNGTENLTGWTLRKGVDFTFPDGLQLAAGDSLFVTAFDPALEAENEATLEAGVRLGRRAAPDRGMGRPPCKRRRNHRTEPSGRSPGRTTRRSSRKYSKSGSPGATRRHGRKARTAEGPHCTGQTLPASEATRPIGERSCEPLPYIRSNAHPILLSCSAATFESIGGVPQPDTGNVPHPPDGRQNTTCPRHAIRHARTRGAQHPERHGGFRNDRNARRGRGRPGKRRLYPANPWRRFLRHADVHRGAVEGRSAWAGALGRAFSQNINVRLAANLQDIPGPMFCSNAPPKAPVLGCDFAVRRWMVLLRPAGPSAPSRRYYGTARVRGG